MARTIAAAALLAATVMGWQPARVLAEEPSPPALGSPMSESLEGKAAEAAMRESGAMGAPAGVVVGKEGSPADEASEDESEQTGEAKPDAEKPKEGADAKPKEEEPDESLKRPDKPPRVPDPREFDVEPDENGLVRFNFYGQPWPDVLQWLANISEFSLDWQELPKDYINVTTTRNYTVVETRDLFNRLLLDRGYTMVEQGRVLTVVRISKLDPSLLPRVEDESELVDLLPHDFVKITFKLPDELKADALLNDVKPLLSPQAKVVPLLATNRLLVIDAVINLREVSRLVNAEHAAALGHGVPREFPIRFARAGEVADQVMILLGLDPRSRRTPQELEVEQQRLQLFQQMQQQGKDITKYLRKDDSPDVFLAVNDRVNSILVNAPRIQMRVIEQAIEQLDIPAVSATGTMSMQKYQLATISPQSVVTALEDIGDLEPSTRLKTDSDARIVFAHATASDHEKIRAVIDKLDGSGRQLEVVWLRRLPAADVAVTLKNLLVGQEEEDDNGDYMRRSIYFFHEGGDGKAAKPQLGFRVDADVERNRLLLWASESEMQEVHAFLEKLGEIPGRSGNPNTVRFLPPRTEEDVRATLDELQRSWKGPNPLRIETPPVDDGPASNEEAESSKSRLPDRRAAAPEAVPEAWQLAAAVRGVSAHVGADDTSRTPATMIPHDDSPEDQAERGTPATSERNGDTVRITTTPDGRLMLQSQDTAALDEIEDLIAGLTPPAPDFKVFSLKYALASIVTLNLKEYFEEEDSDREENWMRAWYGMDFQPSTKSSGGLGQQRKIRFIYDFDTNSILVAHASPAQLKTVKTLIEHYDVPPSEDSISARRFEMFTLKYSRAEDVATTIKEVFRDLLSSKDKDFDSRGGEKQENSQSRNFYRILGGDSGDDTKTTKVRASFEGALSVGVDKVANAVVVSAQEEWMPTIAQMIEFLDEGAAPQTTVAVHRIPGHMNASALRKTLQDVLGQPWVGNRRPTATKESQSQPAQPQGENGSPAPSPPAAKPSP